MVTIRFLRPNREVPSPTRIKRLMKDAGFANIRCGIPLRGEMLGFAELQFAGPPAAVTGSNVIFALGCGNNLQQVKYVTGLAMIKGVC